MGILSGIADAFSAGAISDVFSAGANTILGFKNYQAQQNAYEYQKELNALQMQREDSAYVRTVNDLKNAGLNPALAYGNGANTYTSGSQTPSAPQYQGAPSMFTDYSSIAQAHAQVQNVNADTDLKNAQTGNIGFGQYIQGLQINLEEIRTMSDAQLKGAQYDDTVAHIYQELQGIAKTQQEIENLKATGRLTEQQIQYYDAQTRQTLHVCTDLAYELENRQKNGTTKNDPAIVKILKSTGNNLEDWNFRETRKMNLRNKFYRNGRSGNLSHRSRDKGFERTGAY